MTTVRDIVMIGLTILALSPERRESHVAISRERYAPLVGLPRLVVPCLISGTSQDTNDSVDNLFGNNLLESTNIGQHEANARSEQLPGLAKLSIFSDPLSKLSSVKGIASGSPYGLLVT